MPINETALTAAHVVFWASTLAVAYVYVGYPALVWLLSRIFGSSPRPPAAPALPFVSVIVAAHNEEHVIRERVENLLALDYPPDRCEIVIASDGSTDRTCDIVREFSDPRVRLLAFDRNRGKSAVLNDGVAAARGEILLLSDANTMLDSQAARLLARWFSNPDVDVVSGRLVLVDPVTGRNVDGIYWAYETFMKRSEARLGALLGANGAIYAIRRSHFQPLPSRIAVDDLVVPLLARLQSNRGIVYEQDALAYEETPAEIGTEFTRRSRIGAGGFQSLSLLWPLLNPLRGWIALAFLSHKVLRWICPFFLVGAMAGSTLLVASPLYGSMFAAQVALYALALAVYAWPRLGDVHRVLRVPTMFAAMNLALLAGFYRWALGRQGGTWQRTVRTGTSG